MTILSNLILMLSWSPACLVIHYQYCRRFTIAPLSTYSWVQAIPSLLQFAQRVENFNSKWDQLWRKMFKSIFPRSVMKARYIVIVLFVCLAVGSTVVVFHYPGTNAIKPFLPKLMASVTRFGEKLPIWHNIKTLWPFWKCSFSMSQIFELILANLLCSLANFHWCK